VLLLAAAQGDGAETVADAARSRRSQAAMDEQRATGGRYQGLREVALTRRW